MNKAQQEALRKSRVFLVQNIQPNVLWDHLVTNGVFSPLMIEYMTCKTPRSEQVRALLQELSRRHSDAYEAFLKCLEDTDQGHCALEIRRNEKTGSGRDPVNPTEESSFGGRSEMYIGGASGDKTLSSQIYMPRDEDVEMVPVEEHQRPQPELHTDPYLHSRRSNPEHVYKMESSPRGYAFIINNKNFHQMAERPGTEHDESKLKEVLKDLLFSVDVRQDLTGEEMKTELIEFAKNPLLAGGDCAVVAIFTHGGNKRMYGVDGGYITDTDLIDWFGNQHCAVLRGKPKLFIIQACRGTKEDEGLPVESGDTSLSPSSAFSPSSVSSCTPDVDPEGTVTRERTLADGGRSIPNPTDMFIAYSSVEGYVSYRKPLEGSIFINELTDVFSKQAHKAHVGDMFTMINRQVAKFNTPTERSHCQMPSPTNMLLKTWYLNPPPRK